MQTNDKENSDKEPQTFLEKIPFGLRIMLIFLFLGIFCAGVFLIGAYYGCQVAGDGVLYGLSCKVTRITDVCAQDGHLFIPPENQPISFNFTPQ